MMAKAEKLGKNLYLPIDTTVADGFPNPIDAEIEVSVVAADAIPADKEGLDIDQLHVRNSQKQLKLLKQLYGMDQWVYLKILSLPKEQLPLLRL